ncbi:MAG: type II toxin-antitoxin system RelE/ParE family toxin [Candidatus Yanofskybacteria bacterium]|nr:type II toxin-antitoxin system RelE/ParE family toxin [Candidatus Yanofskybacteria bacterium]
MAYQLRVEPSALRSLNRISGRDRQRIIASLAGIKRDPFGGKALEGKLKGVRSWRVGEYRILYRILKHELLIIVIRIGSRQGIY